MHPPPPPHTHTQSCVHGSGCSRGSFYTLACVLFIVFKQWRLGFKSKGVLCFMWIIYDIFPTNLPLRKTVEI
jgi:hypothetical protein